MVFHYGSGRVGSGSGGSIFFLLRFSRRRFVYRSRRERKRMQQRRSSAVAAGRPSGTDGSDFSYRMVVDSRYTRVADGRSRLQTLLRVQLVQFVGALLLFLAALKEERLNSIALASLAFGGFGLIFGSIGIRRSRAGFLKFYMLASSVASALSILCVATGNLTLEDIQNVKKLESKKMEFLEGVTVVLGLILQMLIIKTVTSLVSNMSPPKRAS